MSDINDPRRVPIHTEPATDNAMTNPTPSPAPKWAKNAAPHVWRAVWKDLPKMDGDLDADDWFNASRFTRVPDPAGRKWPTSRTEGSP